MKNSSRKYQTYPDVTCEAWKRHMNKLALQDNEQIVIFGAGFMGRKLLDNLRTFF